MRVSVFGLGYVGCVSAACLAKDGHEVTGVDTTATKVDIVAGGRSPIVEAGMDELVGETVREGRLRATLDAEEAVRGTDVSLVCVGTPSRPNGSLSLDHVVRVCEQIGRAVARKDGHHLVVIRSTVMPGTLDEIVVPALEGASGKKSGVGFDACVNPEFLREGTSLKDFYSPPFTLVGSATQRPVTILRELYQSVEAPFLATEVRVAEILKYTCNAFHALKVTFANEIGILCRSMGIDSHEVMRIFCLDTKLNLSASYLKPGFAFGGSCLPKDLRALQYRAKEMDVEMPVVGAVLASNRLQVERAINMVLQTGKKSVGILGMAFKAGTDDLRESPMVTLIEALIGKGLRVAIYDRDVSLARLFGANREYIIREIPHISQLMRAEISEVVNDSDVIVIGNRSSEFGGVDSLLRDDHIVIDLVRSFEGRIARGMYTGICW